MNVNIIHLIAGGLLVLVFVAGASASALTISTISPSSAFQGTTGTFNVYGSGFLANANVAIAGGGTTIYATGEYTMNSGRITCTLSIPPTAPAGNYTVYVRNYGEKAWVTKANAFIVYKTPAISSTYPSSAKPGTTLTFYVYGSDFQPGTQVAITGGGTTVYATGETYVSPASIQCLLSIPTTASIGYYNVSVQNPGTTVWVSKANAFFVYAPTASLTVTSPNGRESWIKGATQTITWTSSGAIGSSVKIEMLKGSNVVQTISPGTPNDGTFSWTIPLAPADGSDYRIRITSTAASAITDTSNDYFTITSGDGTLAITSPNGGETWERGTSHTVTWKYFGNPGSTVKIVLLKAGTEVGTIIASTLIGSGGAGSYTWRIYPTGSTGSDYTVRISSISLPGITDTSNAYFTLTPAGPVSPSITVTAPNGGETWQRGTTHKVNWSYTGSTGSTVKITLLKAGTEVGTIAASVPIGSGGLGSYTWPISSTGLTGSDFKVKVQSTSQPAVNDTSNNIFTLTPAGPIPPSITVSGPNGGESWQRGTSHTVNWSYTDNPGSTVKIVLLKAGVEIGTIVSSAPIGSNGKGSYIWPISSTGSTGSDYLVSVRSITLPAITDTSNAYFTLTPAGPVPPSITITTPNGGETWKRGTTHKVNWSYTGSPGSTVKITLWKAGVPVGTINASTSIGSGGKGNYTWPISTTGLTGSDFRVNVSSISQPTIFDMSNNIFTITL